MEFGRGNWECGRGNSEVGRRNWECGIGKVEWGTVEDLVKKMNIERPTTPWRG